MPPPCPPGPSQCVMCVMCVMWSSPTLPIFILFWIFSPTDTVNTEWTQLEGEGWRKLKKIDTYCIYQLYLTLFSPSFSGWVGCSGYVYTVDIRTVLRSIVQHSPPPRLASLHPPPVTSHPTWCNVTTHTHHSLPPPPPVKVDIKIFFLLWKYF